MNRGVTRLGGKLLALAVALTIVSMPAAWGQSLPKGRFSALFPTGAKQSSTIDVEFTGFGTAAVKITL